MGLGHHHGHSHGPHDHHHHAPDASTRAIFWGFVLNLTFTIIEIVGGLWTGSVAILADAIHDLGDSISLGLALGLERYARKKRDTDYSFGYRRYSLLSALISGTVIFGGSLLVLREAIPRLWNPGEIHAQGMMALAVLGLAVNGAAALRLRAGRTQNERMLSWHFWEDTLGWAATLVAALLVRAFGWTLADPILAIALAIFVMSNVARQLRITLRLFLQGKPIGFDEEAFRREACAVPDVTDVHDLHVWSLDGATHVLSMHAALREGADAPHTKRALQALARKHHINHITIETEFAGEACADNCDEAPKEK